MACRFEPVFEPTREAALAALERVNPARYAATRNHLDGAVTRLSPWLTHGLLTVNEVVERFALPPAHKLHAELGWRCFFQHRLQHLGERLLRESQRPAPLPDSAYADALPADVREGRTGLACIDLAVRQLYAEGYLHNHARLWLASHVIHGRRVHWRAGADWLYAHLLDGDAASNHGSWQWVAQRPYLFNAENVARFAPAAWRVDGTPLDAPYAEHEARAAGRLPPLPAGEGEGIAEPETLAAPPFATAAPRALQGEVALRHPWDLRPGGTLLVLPAECWTHLRWSRARWAWLQAAAGGIETWWAPAADQADALRAARVVGRDHPRLPASLRALGLAAAPSLAPALDLPGARCFPSFSAYWRAASGLPDFRPVP
jgi:deoxyribodipyrimidine photo-lyase